MTELARLKFYATQPHPCSYLPEEQATTLFLDPSQPMDVQVYAELSEMGFRRSGDHLYRPHCQRCTACVPARIPADQFIPNRQQRRIIKRNADIQVRAVRPAFNEEYYALYVRYIEQRHADGDRQSLPQRAAGHLHPRRVGRHAGHRQAAIIGTVGFQLIFRNNAGFDQCRVMRNRVVAMRQQKAVTLFPFGIIRLVIHGMAIGHCQRVCQT